MRPHPIACCGCQAAQWVLNSLFIRTTPPAGAWNRRSALLFIDQPVGAGFSTPGERPSPATRICRPGQPAGLGTPASLHAQLSSVHRTQRCQCGCCRTSSAAAWRAKVHRRCTPQYNASLQAGGGASRGTSWRWRLTCTPACRPSSGASHTCRRAARCARHGALLSPQVLFQRRLLAAGCRAPGPAACRLKGGEACVGASECSRWCTHCWHPCRQGPL